MNGFGPDSINKSALADPLLLMLLFVILLELGIFGFTLVFVRSRPNKSRDGVAAVGDLLPFEAALPSGFSLLGLVSDVCFFR